MSKFFRIYGGKPLKGDVTISGYKNAATPIAVAALLAEGPSVLTHVPRAADVMNTLAIMERMGASVVWQDVNTVSIEARNINPQVVEEEDVRVLMRRMRSSVFFFGALLARFGSVRLPYPGGCDIGARPIAAHLDAFRDLGYSVQEDGKWIEIVRTEKEMPREITLSEFSVTATENVLCLLACLPGKVTIHIAAAEPQVQDTAHFLQKMGVTVEGIGTHDLEVEGKRNLHGAQYAIGPDPLEAGMFLLASLASGGHVCIREFPKEHLALMVRMLERAGATLRFAGKEMEVLPSSLQGIDRIQAMPHPGICTDLQPFLTVFATQLPGKTLIHDPLYENRMHTAQELTKMGARISVIDAHRVLVEGPTPLRGAHVIGQDIRSSAALAIAGIIANGETMVEGVEHLERGYEDFDGKLRELGAQIEQIKN